MTTNYLTAAGVQQFSITIASGQTTGTATINAVGSRAFILAGGINPSVSNNPTEDFADVTLTNSTTVTATRNTGTAGTVVITGCVVDATSNLIASVQFFRKSFTGTSTSQTITSVNTNNTAVHLLGYTSSNATYTTDRENPVLALGSSTNVNISRANGTGTLVVGFVVIEFASGALNQNVQNQLLSTASSVTSFTNGGAMSSVNVNNTLLIYGGSNLSDAVGGTNLAQAFQYGQLTDNVTITVNMGATTSLTKQYNCYVVEFISGVLKSNVQRGTTTLTGVASNTSSLTSVNAANSLISRLGNSTSSTTAVLDRALSAASLTNATTETTTKATSTANITDSWEVAEFNSFVAPATAGCMMASAF